MLNSLKRKIEEEISRHFVIYLIIFFVFCAGVIAGMYSLDSLNSLEKQNALNYVNSAFGTLKESSLKWYDIFKNSVYNNSIFFLPLILSGCFTLTIPSVFVIICAKGYLLGFSILFILSGYKFFGVEKRIRRYASEPGKAPKRTGKRKQPIEEAGG